MSHGGYRPGSGAKFLPMPELEERGRQRLIRNTVQEDRGWSSPCWIWQRRIQHDGYSQTEFRSKKTSAHRLAYRLFVGPIGDGLQIDHLCRVRLCCNPAHLEAVTGQENQHRARSYKVLKTCRSGHALESDNVGKYRNGKLFCRTCRNARRRARRASQKAVVNNSIHDGGQ